ncbi:hypothetical protein N7523_005840 [Penicillium sp. IBT 18751x]|nr:hypothetical protein N7523_005840 [Penicillium sp. IBT 18751x]
MSDGQSPTEQHRFISPFTREPSSTSVFNESIGSDVHYPLIPFHQDSHSGANPGQTMADHARLQWQGNHSASVTMSDGQARQNKRRVSVRSHENLVLHRLSTIPSDSMCTIRSFSFIKTRILSANPSQTMVDHKRLQWQENRSASVIMSDAGSPTEQETRIGPFRREPSSTSVVNNSIGSDVHYPLILFHQDSHSGANPGQTMVDHKRLQWHGNCSPSAASLNREVVRVQAAGTS